MPVIRIPNATETFRSFDSLGASLLAGAIWIPMSFGVAAAVTRCPFWPIRRVRPIAVHIVLSALTSFVLNYGWSTVYFALNQPDGGYVPAI